MNHEKIILIITQAFENYDVITLKSKTGSESMRPLILDNTFLYIKRVDYNSIKIGDIILLNFYNELCCHRVVIKNYNTIYTKGDNNPILDYRIVPNQILGKIFKIKRLDKYIEFNSQTEKNNYIIAKLSLLSKDYLNKPRWYKTISIKVMKKLIERIYC
ncbi:MAG: hypothetical protein FWF57_01225 [Defluviitaleaceae bacterium]|nr:hypothetical protein [Defluviitaleaceae bacterium]